MLQPLLNFLGLGGASTARYAVAEDAHYQPAGKAGEREEDEQSTAPSEGASSRGSTEESSSPPSSSPAAVTGRPLRLEDRADRTAQTVSAFRHVAQRYSHTGFDLEVVWHFCVLLGIQDAVDAGFVRTMLETLSLLHRCGYTVDVTVMSVAWAVIYCKDGCVLKALEETPSSKLAQMRVCMHLFLAHTYLVDEPCFLSTWHKHVLHSVCELEDLNAELMQLFKRRNYVLLVDDDESNEVYTSFCNAMQTTSTGKRVVAAIAEDEEGVPQCVDGDY
jgi:hypothetical protein